ncbi:ankyrin repeat domain-containing protein [Myxococcus sp. AM011]|uniref:ankyrin repeat domain-containing protein n=1 Tax=Myxococcus sp. AM011 TaxID=2745200 RepID=UPI001595E5B3|nr:ankyrin repeat domain-containing protein [Myxococcus sp. AM011]NVJ21140.1 ankyrin repeat domain-containing protein [Myxococcus sp. AM011]
MSLFDAVLAGDRESLKSQLDAGEHPDPFDDEGLTPLMVAAREGHTGLVELLLKAGADATITNRIGESAVIIAAAHGSSNCVSVLWESATEDERSMVPLLLRSDAITGPGTASPPTTPPKDDFRRKLASAGAYVTGKLGDDGPTKRLERALRSEKQRKP